VFSSTIRDLKIGQFYFIYCPSLSISITGQTIIIEAHDFMLSVYPNIGLSSALYSGTEASLSSGGSWGKILPWPHPVWL